MGGLCLVIVPGEVAVNLEAPEKFCPMRLTVTAASTISDDFGKMREVLCCNSIPRIDPAAWSILND
jgi:hypothetical protein